MTEVRERNGLRKREGKLPYLIFFSTEIDIVYGAEEYNVIYSSIPAGNGVGSGEGEQGMQRMKHSSYGDDVAAKGATRSIFGSQG